MVRRPEGRLQRPGGLTCRSSSRPSRVRIASGAIVPGSATMVASISRRWACRRAGPGPTSPRPPQSRKRSWRRKASDMRPDFTVAGQGPWEVLNKLGIATRSPRRVRSNLVPVLKASRRPPPITPSRLPSGWKMETRHRHAHAQRHASREGQIRHRSGSAAEHLYARSRCGFISTHASDPALAKALLEYLASPEAQTIWKEAGYGPPQS